MAEKVTIYDISKKLKISAATVSRALNDNPKISEKTRELVLKTATEMNYKQNRLAQALKSGRTNNVGVIIPFINRSFFSSVIRGIEEELSPHGYHVIICQSHEDVNNEIKQIDTLLNTQVDGIFMSVAKTTQDTSHIKKALTEKTPLVFFDRKKEVKGLSSVVIDDFKGGYLATEHLIKQGCTKIAHCYGDLSVTLYKNRHQGYLEALKDNGITPLRRFSLQANSKLESGISAIKELWKFNEKPDAIFCSSDYVALGAIQQLRQLGVKIPEEVCVVGFSNEPFTKYMELPITSVDQTPFEMGKIAAQVFLEKIKGSQTLTTEKHVVLAPKLFVRDSSNRNL